MHLTTYTEIMKLGDRVIIVNFYSPAIDRVVQDLDMNMLLENLIYLLRSSGNYVYHPL
jgi:hypothetical protein